MTSAVNTERKEREDVETKEYKIFRKRIEKERKELQDEKKGKH
jgi:hypothetical protein